MSSARNLLLIQTFFIVAVALAFQGVAISQIRAVEPTVGTGNEDCLPGQEANNYLGVCVDPTCTTGQQRDPAGETRYCVNITCPPGMILDQDANACVSTTPPLSNTCHDGSHGTIIRLNTGQYMLECPPPPFLPPGKTDGLHAPLGNAVNELPLKYHHGFSLSRNTTHSSNDTGGPIAMMSSDNPPGCSKQNPIPPNCTLNPFRNSSTSRAAGGISSSPSGPAENSPSAGGTTGTVKSFTTIGPQGHGQLQSSAQHHSVHHQNGSKQGQTGESSSTGNSTDH